MNYDSGEFYFILSYDWFLFLKVCLFLGQRNKELSYTLRLCHLNATNTDGTPTTTFGFEITKDPQCEYPIISRVESKLLGERAGLQTKDILLKVNNRKTKGLNFDKVKKAIEKAKNNGRLEILVVDKEAFDYCKQTHKKFKEPDIKVKHIFPKSRPKSSILKLPSIAAASSSTTQENTDRLKNGISSFKVHRLSIPRELQSQNEENNVVKSHVKSTNGSDIALINELSDNTHNSLLDEIPFISIDPKVNSNQTVYNSTIDKIVSSEKQRLESQTSTDQSIKNFISNTINNFFHQIGSQKSVKRS